MSGAMLGWWLFLCAAAAMNAALWTWSARTLYKREPELTQEELDTRRAVLWLAAIYVASCAFRSVLPMVDVPRICLHDTPVSRIFIGRTVATISELAFVAQWTLLLREAARATGDRVIALAAASILPLIVTAEAASWYAVLTTDNLFHALENSLWTFTAGLATLACVRLRAEVAPRVRRAVEVVIGCGMLYLLFMVIVDVPMYVTRWLAERAAGHEPLSLSAGLAQTLERCVVTRDWEAWRQDTVWLTLYFTLAVWMSVILPHTPAFRKAR